MRKKPLLIRVFKKFFGQEGMTRFQKNLLTGFFVALPTIITLWVISFVIRLVGTPFGEIINNVFANGEMTAGYQLLLGFVIAIVFLASLGYFAKLAFIRTLSNKIEDYIETIPFVNTIYSTIKLLITSIRSNSKSFQSVAVIEYPRKGTYTLAFITQQNFPVTTTKSGKVLKEMMSVFVPTTPNPTSGFFLLVPKKDVEILDISIEEGLKLIVSAGVISPTERTQLTNNDVFV